jgi:hypothetical protein
MIVASEAAFVQQITNQSGKTDVSTIGSSDFSRAVLSSQLDALKPLKKNWDSFGAEPPKPETMRLARKALLWQLPVEPSAIVASAVGGVAICFVYKDRYAHIEFQNSGEIFEVLYRGKETPTVVEVPDEQGIADALRHISGFFTGI